MNATVGTTGLVLNEPLLWEIGKKGRMGFSLPRRDVDPSPMDSSLAGDGPDFPHLSEVDIVRHYTRLSTWNFGVDSGMYPLGSCTMKYNPKTNERQAALPGLSQAHPLLPPQLAQGALKIMYDLERLLSEVTGLEMYERTHSLTEEIIPSITVSSVAVVSLRNALTLARLVRSPVATRYPRLPCGGATFFGGACVVMPKACATSAALSAGTR